MTINEVYKLVQIFANKEQRGFITPSDFNLLAKQAELELYNKRLDIVKEKSQPKKIAGYYKEGLAPEVAEQDIAHFYYISNVNPGKSAESHLGATSDVFADYISHVTINSSFHHDIKTNIPVDIVTPENVSNILRSSLVKPSMAYPIALINNGAVGWKGNRRKRISLFPNTIERCTVYYYLYDNTPKWSYVTIAGKPVYDVSTSMNFQISTRCHGELVVKILEYLGVHLREADVVQYASGKEMQEDS
jgi:hypothetical protein